MPNYKYIVDILAKNQQFVTAMNQNVQKIAEVDKKVENTQKSVNSAMSGMVKMAGAVGIAFGAMEAKELIVDSIKLAAEAQGVSIAFSKIGKVSDLDNLRQSVKGTVADLDLMKRAVTASNFGIPVQQLGKLFEFATKRAQDTGQSVDYLVDSIVTGIGRKSPLILDNLGISAVQLKEKLGKVSTEAATVGDIAKAVGSIAEDALKKSGGLLDTDALKIQKVSASWQNLKETFGKSILQSSTISKDLDSWSQLFEIWASETTTTWESVLSSISGAAADRVYKKMQLFKDLQSANTAEVESSLPVTENTTKAAKVYANTIEGLNEKLKDYNDALKLVDPSDRAALMAKLSQINAVEKQIKSIDKLKEAMASMSEDASKGLRSQKIPEISTRVTGKLSVKRDEKDFNLKPKLDISDFNANAKQIEAANKYIQDSLDRSQDKVRAIQGAFEEGFSQIGKSVTNGLGLASDGLEGFVSGMIETVTKLIAIALSESIANSIVGATASGAATGPAAIFTTPAFIATAVAGVLGAFAAIPKFADGGIAYGPTLGLMGEYPGASSNPEVIAPLSDLKGMLGNSEGSTTVILQPGLDFSGDKLRVYLKRIDDKTSKRTGKK